MIVFQSHVTGADGPFVVYLGGKLTTSKDISSAAHQRVTSGPWRHGSIACPGELCCVPGRAALADLGFPCRIGAVPGSTFRLRATVRNKGGLNHSMMRVAGLFIAKNPWPIAPLTTPIHDHAASVT